MKFKSSTAIITSVALYVLLGSFTTSAQTRDQSRQLQQPQPTSSWPSKAKRWALVIGVDQYRDGNISPLRGAANDANSLARALTQYSGFPADQVILLATDQPEGRQPTRINILTYLSNLAKLVPKDGLLLVSFAGHGIERGGQAYLIPSDARLTDDVSLLEESAVSVTRMHDRIRATGVNQIVVLLDACRNDPGGRADAPNPLTTAYTRGFNFDVRNREVSAFVTLYATAIGQRAYEYADKKQGYFTWALVEALKGGAANEKGEVTLAQLVRYVQENVPKRVAIDLGASKQQRPFYQMEGYKAEDLVIALADKSSPSASEPATSNATVAASLAEQYIKSGDQLISEKKWSEAANEYKLAVRLDSANAEWHNKLGFALHSDRKYSEAESEYRAALQLAPNNAESHYGLGRALREQKKLNEAETEIREAIRLEPESAKFHAGLANTLGVYQQRWAEAETEIAQAIHLDPNNIEWRSISLLILEGQKKYAEAEAQAREEVRLHPDTALFHSWLGRELRIQKKAKNAEAEYREALRLEPHNTQYLDGLGYSLLDQQRWVEAETIYKEVIGLEPNTALYHNRLGVALNPQNKLAEAETQYQVAIRLEPNTAGYHSNLGDVLGRQKRWAEGESELKEAIRLDPSFVIAHATLAWVFFGEQKWADAESEGREALRLDGNYAPAHGILGAALQAQKKFAEAETEYREAVRLDPNSTELKEALEQILKAQKKRQ
jgi:Flp pilus assembly protein TadD